MSDTDLRTELNDTAWSGGMCDDCNQYAARLHWGFCPRCRRSKAGKAKVEQRLQAALAKARSVT